MTVVLGLLGLSFLVFFHELGHFVAARIFGVKVEAFSVGMGPVLLHHKRGGTDYRLSLIPIGGYCSMKGEKDYQKALDLNLKSIEGDPDSFYGVHPLKRAVIGFAGPFFNILFAFIAFFIIGLTGYSYYSAGTTVTMADEVYDMHSAAHEAGMQTGDTILSINGRSMEDFSDISMYVSMHGNEDLLITVLRGENKIDLTVHSDMDSEIGGKIGIVADSNSVVQKTVQAQNVFKAFGTGIRRTGEFISLTVQSVGLLFKGIDISTAVSGPVRITSLVGSTVKEGFSEGIKTGLVSTLELLSLISISLFFTNLLPIPVLDGALILFALAEWITGRKMSPKVLYYIQLAGVILIGIIFVFVLILDIKSFF